MVSLIKDYLERSYPHPHSEIKPVTIISIEENYYIVPYRI